MPSNETLSLDVLNRRFRFRRKFQLKTSVPHATFSDLRSQGVKLFRRRLGRVAHDRQLSFANGMHPFHVGDRSGQSAQALWDKIPAMYQEQAVFYTDHYVAYTGVIPSAQHRAIFELARKTNHVERFNCTLRQRVSRLVRATLSFSKKLSNHIGAIKYFICDYNLFKINHRSHERCVAR